MLFLNPGFFFWIICGMFFIVLFIIVIINTVIYILDKYKRDDYIIKVQKRNGYGK